MTFCKKYVLIIPLILLITYIIIYLAFGNLNLKNLQAQHDTLQSFVDNNYYSTILVFATLYITATSLSLPAATILNVLLGIYFGQWVGTIIVIFSATIGASILFLMIKNYTLNAKFIESKKWIKSMQKGFQKNAFFYMLSLRCLPFFPFTIVNVGAGILKIPFKAFFWGTLIGIIPISFIYVTLGATLKNIFQLDNFMPSLILDTKAIIILVALSFLSLIPIIYKKYNYENY